MTRVVSRWVRLLASRVGSDPVASCHVMCFYVVSYHVVLCLVMMISCRVMSDRILLVRRFASLESR